jgi:hypothetical protein
MVEILAAIICVTLVVGLAVLILRLRDRIVDARYARRNPPEKIAAERSAYEQRILHPDWEFYERHLGRPAPPPLRELYRDSQIVTAQNIAYGNDECIATFAPLDKEGALDPRVESVRDVVPIAYNQFGDPIYLRPGASEPDSVCLTFLDGGDTKIFAESIAAMVARLRAAWAHRSGSMSHEQ